MDLGLYTIARKELYILSQIFNSFRHERYIYKTGFHLINHKTTGHPSECKVCLFTKNFATFSTDYFKFFFSGFTVSYHIHLHVPNKMSPVSCMFIGCIHILSIPYSIYYFLIMGIYIPEYNRKIILFHVGLCR